MTVNVTKNASADCFQNEQNVLCSGIDFDGFLTTQESLTVDIELDALVRNINTVERRGNFPLSFPAISVGQNSAVTNQGSILTFGVCGTGIQAGANSEIINNGTIDTNDILSYGIEAGLNSTIVNDGMIRTHELAGHGLFVDNNVVIGNTEDGWIETSGATASGINGRNAVTVTNAGTIVTTGQGSHGIDLLGNGTISNSGNIEVGGFQSVGIRLRAGPGTVTNTGSIVGLYTGSADPSNPEDGIQIEGVGINVENTGSIDMSASGAAGVRIVVNGAGDASLTNSGTITAPGGGVTVAAPQGRVTIINSGVIAATDSVSPAIQIISGPESQSFVTNSGVIAAENGIIAISGGDGREEVINKGVVTGGIALAGGNDLLTLQTGSSLSGGGPIDGGSGTDDLVLTGDGSVDADFSGFEELTKFGNGRWLLLRDADFTNRVRIIEGALAVESGVTLSSADINIFEDGDLRLAGTVTGPVFNDVSLTVTPGAAIDGMLIQTANGSLTVLGVEGESQESAALSVAGSAVVDGTLRVDVSVGPLFTDGAILTVLTAATVSGSIAAVDVGGGAFLSGAAAVAHDSIQVLFDRLPYGTAARSGNSHALADALDESLAKATPDAQPLFRSLDAMSLDTAGNALNSLTTSLPLALVALDLLAVRDAIIEVTTQTVTSRNVWGHIDRSDGSFNGETDGHLGHRATRLSAGSDFTIGDTQAVGFSVSKLDYRATSPTTASRADGSAYVFGARYVKTWNAWIVRAGLMAGDLNGTTQRLGGLNGTSSVTSDGDGLVVALAGRLGRILDYKKWIFETEIGLTNVDVSREAISESGAAIAALEFDKISEHSLRADISGAIHVSLGSVSPRLGIGVSHEFDQTQRTVNAALAVIPDAPFRLGLRPEERTWIETELRVPYRLRPGFEVALTASGVLNDKTGCKSIALTARLDW